MPTATPFAFALAAVLCAAACAAAASDAPVSAPPAVRTAYGTPGSGKDRRGTGGAGDSSAPFVPQACTLCAPSSGFPAYGEPSDTFPAYVERVTLIWYNMARTAPAYFKSQHLQNFMNTGDTSYTNVFSGATYPAVRPISWNLNLNRLARAHCVDRLTCNSGDGGSPHNDCNSTTFGTRMGTWYGGGGGEIYWEYPSWSYGSVVWPFYGVLGWVCDGPMYSNGLQSGCAVDGSGSDGHRDNIMTVNGEVGCGLQTSGNRLIHTCNQGGSVLAPTAYAAATIKAGAHYVVPTRTNSYTQYKFAVSYYSAANGGAPASAQVYVNGAPVAMTMTSGAAATVGGTWESAAYSFTATTPCSTYYFQFDATRYPTTGSFSTYGVGACTSDWTSASGQSGGGGGGGGGGDTQDTGGGSESFASTPGGAATIAIVTIGAVGLIAGGAFFVYRRRKNSAGGSSTTTASALQELHSVAVSQPRAAPAAPPAKAISRPPPPPAPAARNGPPPRNAPPPAPPARAPYRR